MIEPSDGWLERDGKRQPLPPALIAHERQQYGIYGYLLVAEGRGVIHRTHAGFPPIRLETDRTGRIVAADYTVAGAEDGRPLPQHFGFDGEIVQDGVRWFRHMTIHQSGRRYFQLTLDDLFVEHG